MYALSWLVTEGHVGDTDVSGLTAVITGRYHHDEQVTCLIPGHESHGEELTADLLKIDDGDLHFEFEGNCAYAADFAYAN